MPWKPQGGGPWGGDNGGQGGPPRGGPQPPDFEELFKRSQDKVKSWLPGGAGGLRGLILLVLAVIGIWGFSGIYRINPGEQGVELLFGKYMKRTAPGLHFWFPSPIGDAIKLNVDRTNSIQVGYRGVGDSTRSTTRSTGIRDVPQESLMLTADQNIIDVDFVIQWRIKNAADFLFNIRNPEGTIKIAAESAIREVIGRTPMRDALTVQRAKVDQEAVLLLQEILDSYKSGVVIADLKQQNVDPPKEVIDAFNDVQRAKQDQQRKVNEAAAYSNDIVPRARGEAHKMIQDAEAYKAQMINEAEGEAKRFLSIYTAYKGNKAVTKRRMYLERMQEILNESDKVIIDTGAAGGPGVVPYLPLPELKKRSRGTSQ
ncbi:MAG: FtsH protease activity modulator HflK [Rhodospirillales bacterium]